jgi:lipopolysaccharide/colanic/teichoic acid biosynthesis glycosyltransferase
MSACVPGAEGIGDDSRARRAIDAVVAGVALLLSSPVLALVSLAIRATSRGPAVFRQQRVGRAGRCFTIWKFRTMVADAAERGGAVSGSRDPRVTSVGRCLRGTRLDELPQLVNVLRGDMTLIGPRPEVPSFVPYYTPEERLLLSVRPGVIGPGAVLFARTQSHQLDDADDPEELYLRDHLHAKLALDLAYLRDRRLSCDLRLLGAAVAVTCRLDRRWWRGAPTSRTVGPALVPAGAAGSERQFAGTLPFARAHGGARPPSPQVAPVQADDGTGRSALNALSTSSRSGRSGNE